MNVQSFKDGINICTILIGYNYIYYTHFKFYFGDMIITGTNVDGIAIIKLELARCFAIKGLGSLDYFLNIEVASSLKGCPLLNLST